MIAVNGKVIDQNLFPDETPHLKFSPVDEASWSDDQSDPIFNILWLYDRMSELFNVICLVDKIRKCFQYRSYITLTIPYLPNARMDRCEKADDVFTLETFSKLINQCNFDEVCTFDVHSDVSKSKIAKLYDESPIIVVDKAARILIEKFNVVDLHLFYPDKGAQHRYSNMFPDSPWASADKQRDWNTGKIIGLEISEGSHRISGNDFLIIDDICSKGGTFYHAANKLKELGANRVFLYVSHLERTVHDGLLLKEDSPIEHIFTTNSIYRWGSKNKITVINHWRYEYE